MATSQQIYSEINSAINPENSSKRPTMAWIAGTFKKAYDFGRIQRAVDEHSKELDTKTLENFINTLKFRDIAVKNGLMTKTDEGKYVTSERGNRFIQDLSKNIKQWESINDLSFKQLRGEVQSAKGEVDQEWYNNLPPVEQHVIDIYSRLTPKEFHLLTGLKNDRDNKQKYVNRIETLEDSDPESYAILRDAGIINNKNQINNTLLSTFFATLAKYDYRHLRSFNRSISSKSDRIAADKGLAQNYLNRSLDKNSPRNSDIGVRAREFIEDSNGCTKSWIEAMAKGPGQGVRCSQVDFDDLRLQGIVTTAASRELTTFGKLVASLIKTGRGMNSFDEKEPLNSRMPTGAVADNDRQRQRSKILGGRKAAFNDRMHRTKTEESKNLSFKKYLIEQQAS
jgi:hypothetical protein